MSEKTISGSVFDEQGIVIGQVSGTYIDEYGEYAEEKIASREIQVTVYAENKIIGTGKLIYDDYISFSSGGTRTITLSGSVFDEQLIVIGQVSGSLYDEYGAIQLIEAPAKKRFPWWLLLIIPLLLLIKKKREQEET